MHLSRKEKDILGAVTEEMIERIKGGEWVDEDQDVVLEVLEKVRPRLEGDVKQFLICEEPYSRGGPVDGKDMYVLEAGSLYEAYCKVREVDPTDKRWYDPREPNGKGEEYTEEEFLQNAEEQNGDGQSFLKIFDLEFLKQVFGCLELE